MRRKRQAEEARGAAERSPEFTEPEAGECGTGTVSYNTRVHHYSSLPIFHEANLAVESKGLLLVY